MKTVCLILAVLLIGLKGYTQTDTANKVFTFVEQNPQFPGGDKELMKFLQQNIKYPEWEMDHNIQGRVLLRFVIDTDGTVTDVTVAKSVEPALDNEAVRVIKLLPKFTPGKQKGTPVRVYFNLPVVFRLTESSANEKRIFAAKVEKDKYFKKAVFFAGNESFEEAITWLKKSISKFPDDYLAYDMLADCSIRIGKNKDACTYSNKAKALGSSDADAFLNKHCR